MRFYQLLVSSAFVFSSTFASLSAEAKTNIAVHDINFDTVPAGNSETVKVNVVIQKQQAQKFQRLGLPVEIRFYVGEDKNQAKRIMKNKDYYLNDRGVVSDFTFSPSEACAAPGEYWAKIWLSVRHADGRINDGYETYQEFYPYTCPDPRRVQNVAASTEFRLADPVGRDRFNQLNLLVSASPRQLAEVNDRNLQYEVLLYVLRDGKRIRVNGNKRYIIDGRAGRQSFTFPIKTLCGEADNILEEIFGREVSVGCSVQVTRQNGSPDSRYRSYSCKTQDFVCFN